MVDDTKDLEDFINSDENNSSSDDDYDPEVQEKTFFISEVHTAELVSQLEGKMVGNVLKSFMGNFLTAEKFAEMLKKAGFIVKIVGGSFASKVTSDKNKPRSR